MKPCRQILVFLISSLLNWFNNATRELFREKKGIKGFFEKGRIDKPSIKHFMKPFGPLIQKTSEPNAQIGPVGLLKLRGVCSGSFRAFLDTVPGRRGFMSLLPTRAASDLAIASRKSFSRPNLRLWIVSEWRCSAPESSRSADRPL
jgi:hypothetical protein